MRDGVIEQADRDRKARFGDDFKNKSVIELEKYAVNFRPVKPLSGLNDLIAALNRFVFHMVVKGTVTAISFGKEKFHECTIEEVGVYVADIFDFTDKPGEDQYLGCWNLEKNDAEYNILLPCSSGYQIVHNSDFRKYREATKMGEDFLVFSDVKWMKPTRNVVFFVEKYLKLKPKVVGVTPSSGAAGTQAVISLADSGDVVGVQINGQSIPFEYGADAMSLSITLPADATTGLVSLQTAGGEMVTSGASFTVTPPPATGVMLSADPSSQVVVQGQSATYNVKLNRTNFTGPMELALNGLPFGASAEFSPNPLTGDSAILTITTTAGKTTLGTQILTINGSVPGAPDVTVIPAAVSLAVGLAPAITSVSPIMGSPDSSVEIAGANFDNVSDVRFNGVPATAFIVADPLHILATVPQGATTGKISITTPFGTAKSDGDFQVTTGNASEITQFSPTSGTLGTPVTISGTGFTEGATVAFNGVPAPVNSISPTEIRTAVPRGATTGLISVMTREGNASSRMSFTVLPSVAKVDLLSTPTTQGITTGQSASYTIALQRTNFTGAVALAVSGLPASATAVFRDNPTTGTRAVLTITTTVGTPARSSLLTISATASGVTIAPLTVSLTVNAAVISLPVISGFTPSRGPVATPVTITDLHFEGTTAVAFNRAQTQQACHQGQ